ncbi:hypothetical protein Ssi03_12800 [Sphaerisporangium siamense]|uniref:Head-tail adaptor protein n=1 Tax=Sphaerisporangium siamense TaxID=795645 RepID=A0A7W7DC47_9ACTN|nr:hypothetical protein [Sphaerisporangium siamense]MBB4702951.1 hypothetical protein [Sphaerisporangium siamense]GII83290.1 hypothetical protein Ssi03_12800 [Sphaerisporangium siamense]
MILDRAPENIKIFKTEWVEDGYGGGRNPVPSSSFLSVKAFILPTGFAGAGWAANMRFASQGWADTARVSIVIKWSKELVELDQWSQVEAQGQIWTVVQAPRRWSTRRVNYVTVLCELKGDVE